MSMGELQADLMKFLSAGRTDQQMIIERLKALYSEYGSKNIQKWRNASNQRNSLLHEFVEKEMSDVIRCLILDYKFDINTRRDSDGLTALQLAVKKRYVGIANVLSELGAQDIEIDDAGSWLSDDDKEKAMNIVWMDLEMTSIENPEILECAVIITDKNLNELNRANWIIHFDQSVLDTLGDWHQKTFADVSDEGNGLFADVLKSKLTKDQVENELLTLLKRYCPPKQCPLAGNSIHTDKKVLEKCMPRANDYLHYQIIDVTSFQLIMRRWVPELELKVKKHTNAASNGQKTGAHRAMNDIERSLAIMKQIQYTFSKLQSTDLRRRETPNNNPRISPLNSPHGRGGVVRQRMASNHDDRHSNDDDNDELPTISVDANQMELYSDERRLIERIEIERMFSKRPLRLADKWRKVYNRNPHLREVFMNGRFIENNDKDFTKDHRILTTTVPSSNSGNENGKKYSTTEHWGQRKLLLTEMEFLTKYAGEDKYTVVYAGAAPGSHLNFLASLFPDLDFIFIDEKELLIQPAKNIHIQKEKFTNELARHYSSSSRNLIFICNIRTFRVQADGQNDLKEDMQNQLDWYGLLKPQFALLNFRLPRQSGKTSYLKGHLIIEPWTSKRPTECRLVVKKDARMIDYNHQDFEDDLLRFQNSTRIMYYKHSMDDVDNEGLDHCYDCRTEIFIIQEYLMKIQKLRNDHNAKNAIATMSREISIRIHDKTRPRFLNVQRTLAVIPKKSPNA